MPARPFHPLLIAAVCSVIGSIAVLTLFDVQSKLIGLIGGGALAGGLAYLVAVRATNRRRRENESMRDSALW
jgi:hypothetical protein